MNKYKKITLDGLIFNNPTFMLVLGTCPTLGLISSAFNAMGMGLTVVVILTLSNIIISALRNVIPNEVRIPAYIVIIATLVTFVRFILDKYIPSLYESLGGFLALIVVNCIILGRAEAFASKHTVAESAVDGLATGFGFAIAITIMGIICEVIGKGSFFGIQLWSFSISMFATPAGAFIVYGICIAIFATIIEAFNRRKTARENRDERNNMIRELTETKQEVGGLEA